MELKLTPPSPDARVRRPCSGAAPRFKADRSAQLDPLVGCPQVQVPPEHLARRVQYWVSLLDLSPLEGGYSVLGRHGYHPAQVLAVWLYASLTKVHEATEVARRMETDAAYRLLSGGYTYSDSTLRKFRQACRVFLAYAVGQTAEWAVEEGLVAPDDLSLDGVRLRANASVSSMRTQSRAEKRLGELQGVDTSALEAEQQAAHEEKVEKHTATLERCEAEGRTSFSTTNPEAGLIKFPDGGSAPGHRVTVVAAGQSQRLVVGVLLNAAGHDNGQLPPALLETRRQLQEAGLPPTTVLQVAADAGYFSEENLRFAAENSDWLDLLVNEQKRGPRLAADGKAQFGRECFRVQPDGTAICPAGKPMRPASPKKNRRRWVGVGCPKCPLRSRCTKAGARWFSDCPSLDALRSTMHARLESEDGRKRYNRRIATVEPVFAYLETNMGFRRSSSQLPDTIHSELLMKILAYNLTRLAALKPLRFCPLLVRFDRERRPTGFAVRVPAPMAAENRR